MIAETVNIIVSTSKNSSVKALELVWIPYHDGVYVATSIPFLSNTIHPKYPEKEAPVIDL